jgi:hypothetical protein
MSSQKEESSFLSKNYQQNFVIVTSQPNFSLNSITNKWFQYSDLPTMTKIFCSSLLSLTLFTLGCLTSNAAIAQTKVFAKPDALTVTGIRGAATKETRTLTLRSTDPINNIRIYAFDLYNSDRDRVFPKSLITVPSQVKLVNNESLETFPVEFNLQNSPSGEFQGEILISYDSSEVSVPVIVRVKDPWYLPFTLLVFGVLLGTTVSSYSRSGRLTDEISVSIASLRTQLKNDIESDPKIPLSFVVPISNLLIDAESEKDAGNLDAARKSINKARSLWNEWLHQREELKYKHKYDHDQPISNLPELEITGTKSVDDTGTEISSLPSDDNFILQAITNLIPNPNQRLQIFSIAGYLATIAFFAGTGFNQLYLESPTFGANGIKDYFALIAWGFGAEATRNAITNAIRKTDTQKS